MSNSDSTVILHLTDLHFGWEGGPNAETLKAQRTNCLNALHAALKKLVTDNSTDDWKPNVVAITGDLGWKGAAADYQLLKNWLDPLLQDLGLGYDSVVVCPGNHDIDRQTAKYQTRPATAAESDELLGVPIPSAYANCFADYSQYCTTSGIPAYKLGTTSSHLVGFRDLRNIRFIALNSAWYCRGDKDLAQLWVGRNHLQQLQAENQLPEAQDSDRPVVAIVHHPPSWWHDADQITRDNRSCVRLMLAERSHVILTGHEHCDAERSDRINERAILMKGGATYAGAQYNNNVRLIRISREHVQYRVLEYNPRLITENWQLGHVSEPQPLRRPSVPTPAPTTPAPPIHPAVSAYLARLTESTKSLELMGLGRATTVELPIADAYVPLRASRSPSMFAAQQDRGKRPGFSTADATDPDESLAALENLEQTVARETRELPLDQIFHECKSMGQRGVILLGEPGAGKTTGARQLAWQLASGGMQPAELGLPAGILPVFLRLRNLKADSISAVADPIESLKHFLRQEVRGAGETAALQDPCDALWDHSAGLLWIIDGLDEVVDPQLRAVVSQWIQRALPQRLQDYFLVTCRFQGYSSTDVALGGRFVEFHVDGLSDQQVRDFVNRWFLAANIKLHPGDSGKAAAIAGEVSATLLRVLDTSAYQTRSMRELVTNPLLLTILCIVYHEERNLPTARAELYQQCVKVLLGLWRKDFYSGRTAQGSLQPFDAEAAQSVLARLAWWLHQSEQRTAGDMGELAAEAITGLQQVSQQSGLGLDGTQFVNRMREESGILALSGEGSGRIGFMHLSFQEYLAADHAVREGLSGELAPRLPQSWWQEVALLSLRRSKAYCGRFFRDLLSAGLAEQHPELAQRCLTESLYFAPEPFMDVLQSGESTVQRRTAVLRLLLGRQRQVPGLGDLCEQFVQSTDPAQRDLRSIATELLVSLGRQPVTVGAPSPFQVFVDGRTGVTFIWIPPGEFRMGSEKRDWTQPVHTVRLTQGFYVGKYPVTNAQYGRYLREQQEKLQLPAFWDDRRFNQPEQPVVGVSWDEAVAYSRWAGGRLPTEAEWEYSCRAGSTGDYCFGDDTSKLQDYAWYWENSGQQTHPVGEKQANDWGLHDMHGNVWEWCQDRYGKYSAEVQQDPAGPATGPGRVLRGGAWRHLSHVCSAWFRNHGTPDYRVLNFGFRLARTLPPDP